MCVVDLWRRTVGSSLQKDSIDVSSMECLLFQKKNRTSCHEPDILLWTFLSGQDRGCQGGRQIMTSAFLEMKRVWKQQTHETKSIVEIAFLQLSWKLSRVTDETTWHPSDWQYRCEYCCTPGQQFSSEIWSHLQYLFTSRTRTSHKSVEHSGWLQRLFVEFSHGTMTISLKFLPSAVVFFYLVFLSVCRQLAHKVCVFCGVLSCSHLTPATRRCSQLNVPFQGKVLELHKSNSRGAIKELDSCLQKARSTSALNHTAPRNTMWKSARGFYGAAEPCCGLHVDTYCHIWTSDVQKQHGQTHRTYIMPNLTTAQLQIYNKPYLRGLWWNP